MPEFEFTTFDFKQGLAIAKIIKPESGDFCFRFSESSLTIFCYDKRRYVCSTIHPDSLKEVPEGFLSNEFYLTTDRVALFDTDLSRINIKVNERSLSIRVHGDDQERRANLKKRSIKSKRPSIPKLSFNDKPHIVDRKTFEQLLYQVSCSAQIKETKTEEDMRINQVHFYPEKACAVSNARYYGSTIFMEGMDFDISVVSTDIPAIRTFCSKSNGAVIQLYQDDKRIFIIDPDSGSILSVGKIISPRPQLILPDSDKFETEIVVNQTQLVRNLGWASIAIEGTQRLNLRASRDSGHAEFYFNKDKISEFSVEFIKGDKIDADFPVKFFLAIVSYLGNKVRLRYHHADTPTILEITECVEEVGKIRSIHYLQSMRIR